MTRRRLAAFAGVRLPEPAAVLRQPGASLPAEVVLLVQGALAEPVGAALAAQAPPRVFAKIP